MCSVCSIPWQVLLILTAVVLFPAQAVMNLNHNQAFLSRTMLQEHESAQVEQILLKTGHLKQQVPGFLQKKELRRSVYVSWCLFCKVVE